MNPALIMALSNAAGKAAGALGGLGEKGDKAGGAMDGATGKASALGGVLQGVTSAFGGFVAGLTSFVSSALPGTNEGQQLSEMFSRVHRTLASAFLPIVELVSNSLVDMEGMFQGVTNMIQPAVQALADVLYKVWQAFQPFIDSAMKTGASIFVTSIEMLTDAFRMWMPVIQKIGDLMKGMASGMVGWVDRIRSLLGYETLSDKTPKAARMLTSKTGGFEDVAAAYSRIAAASVQTATGKTIEQRQLENSEQHVKELQKLNGTVDQRLRPAVAK